ncbi:tyrosine-type recombinase/integrase [Paenibacillus sp. GYB003]|uniref:tyrosine-type recombinase/integrase n=1 Tax=Paenibacillus sp. GYB003 TaxID=2994392 RepID=UPI002F968373
MTLSFQTFLQQQELDRKTIVAYTQAVSDFFFWFEDTNGVEPVIEQLDASHFNDYREYLREKRRKPRTINKHLAGIRKWLEHLQREGRWPHPIQIRDVKVQLKQTAPKWRKLSEIGAICNGIEKEPNDFLRARDRCMLYFELFLGLRDEETRLLEMEDVILTPKKEKVIIRNAKRDIEAELPIASRKLKRAIKDWIEERTGSKFADSKYLFVSFRSKSVSRSAVDRMLARVRKASSVDFTNHELRHSFVYHFNEITNKIRLTQDVARHAAIQTTTIYTNPSEDDRTYNLAKLDDIF